MKRPAKEFTMIELLVTIAIIAILSALLFPALSQARQAATRIGCASNMKQIFLGLDNYATDYNEYILLPYDEECGLSLWMDALFSLGYLPTPRNYAANNISQGSSLLHCPGARKESIYYNEGGILRGHSTSYGLLYPACAVYPNAATFWMKYRHKRRIDHRNFSTRYYLRDWLIYYSYHYGSGSSSPYIDDKFAAPSHGSGKNHLFLDGHVEWLHFGSIAFGSDISTAVWELHYSNAGNKSWTDDR